MRTRQTSSRTAFTLVEMLVVIAIIGILVALLLPAIGYVQKRANVAVISVEIKNLESAVEAYKLKYGDYPPDFSDRALVQRHILKAWPKINLAETVRVTALFWNTGLTPADTGYYRVDPAEALAFWLGGFSADPRRPFTGTGGPFIANAAGVITGVNPDRNLGTMDFDRGQLTFTDDGDFFPVYLPKRRKMPFVYFDARTYGGQDPGPPYGTSAPINGFYPLSVPPVPSNVETFGIARPYLSTRAYAASPFGVEWVNRRTYQIVSAGLDDHYGGLLNFRAVPTTLRPYPVYPTGQNYTSPYEGDDDNITNFSEGGTLGDQKP